MKAWDEISSRKNVSKRSKEYCVQSSCKDKMLVGPSKQEADPLVPSLKVRFNQSEVVEVFQQNDALPQQASNHKFNQHRLIDYS